MTQKGERLVGRISDAAVNAATLFMLVIFVIQVIDIIGSKLFNKPLNGVVELTGYFVAVLVPAAAAKVFLTHQHVRIEMVTQKLPARVNNAIDRVVNLVLGGLLSVLTWKTVAFGISKQQSGQYSDTLHFPFYLVIYFEAAALAVFSLVLLYSCVVLPKVEDHEKEEKTEEVASDGPV